MIVTISLTGITLEALAAIDAEEVGLVPGGGMHREEVLLQGFLALEFLRERSNIQKFEEYEYEKVLIMTKRKNNSLYHRSCTRLCSGRNGSQCGSSGWPPKNSLFS